MIRHLASLAAVLCFAMGTSASGLTTPAHAQPAASAGSVGPEVVLVRVAGPWQSGGQQGFSRLVGTASADGVALTVEWVSDAGAVVQSMPLTSPPSSQALPLARMRGDTGAEDSALYLDTGDDTFVLIVGAPGSAKFGPASN